MMISQKRKIAIVSPDLAGTGGGVATVASFIYEAIRASQKYEVDLISIATSARDASSVRILSPQSWLRGIESRNETWRGRDVLHIGCRFAELEPQRYMPRGKLTNLLNRYDLVQVISGTPAWAFVTMDVKRPVCLFIATITRAERVSVIEETKGPRKIWIIFVSKIAEKLERLVLPKMSFVFAESYYTKELVEKYVANHQLGLGIPGVDTNIFYPSYKRSEEFILSVGRFSDPRKNVRLLFQAYARLLKLRPNSPHLVLAGNSGPTEHDWQFADALGIRCQIEFRQGVPMAELVSLYQNAAVFVLSSDEEGLGMVILEAMACGTPVIATRCGGPESVIMDGKTGFLVPKHDPEMLANRLRHLLENHQLRVNMGQNARNLAEQVYSLEAASKIYLMTYDALLGTSASS